MDHVAALFAGLDVRTLWVAISLNCTLYAVLPIVRWVRDRSQRSAGAFGLMSLLAALAAALIAARGILPVVVSNTFANSLMMLVPATLWSGMRTFSGRPFSWWFVFVPSLAAGALFAAVPSLGGNVVVRVLVGATLASLYLSLIVVDIVRDEQRERLVPRRLIAVACAACLVTMPYRYVSCVTGSVCATLVQPGSLVFALSILAAIVAIGALIIMMLNERLATAVFEASIRDQLTGLYDRRGLGEIAPMLLDRAPGVPAAVLAMDIDRFKSVNDRYGHPAGDRVLQEFARLVRAIVPPAGKVFRHGGEEFCAVIPACSAAEAAAIAERIRRDCERARITAAGGAVVTTTVSIGVACSTDDEPIDRILGRADAALYDAKRGGRNRVVAVVGADRTLDLAPVRLPVFQRESVPGAAASARALRRDTVDYRGESEIGETPGEGMTMTMR